MNTKTDIDAYTGEPFSQREQALIDLLWDYLKRDSEHKDRRQTSFGTKTKRGLVECIDRINREKLATGQETHGAREK